MVGSVLLERMTTEGDWKGFEPTFFSTSRVGANPPATGLAAPAVADAKDLATLGKMDVIVSCQGGDYTADVHPRLRRAGFKGFWIDAASTLRMKDDAVLILDPVNMPVIERALAAGVRDFIGANCTVSLMLMAMAGPISRGWVEWISSMTYQAASGAGAKNMQELAAQMRAISDAAGNLALDPTANVLDLDRAISAAMSSPSFPTAQFGAPLAPSLIPWIADAVAGGQTREEWKAHAEANKILGLDPPLPVDGICVRVGAMRCHSQGLTIKLKRAVPQDEFEACIRESNAWVKVIANTEADTKRRLTPAAITGTLDVAIGRIHTLKMGPEYFGAFTVGDQLLWGAAEPLRRMLAILLERSGSARRA